MVDPSSVLLVLALAVVAGSAAHAVVTAARARRVPPHVRVGQLRQALRAAPPGAEVRVDPLRYRRLTVEMVLHVARAEGFRLVADRRRPGRGASPELVLGPVGGGTRR